MVVRIREVQLHEQDLLCLKATLLFCLIELWAEEFAVGAPIRIEIDGDELCFGHRRRRSRFV